MKDMVFLLSIITLLSGCSKENKTINYLPGKWELYKTELYVNGTLQGEVEYNEITTIYQFNNCVSSQENNCEMYISEDGGSDIYSYTYDTNTSQIVLDNINTYNVDLITENELILSKEYNGNRSIWSFAKGE